MHKRVRTFSLPTALLTALALLFLNGCVASKKDQFVEDMMAKGVNPLSTAELNELFPDSTMSHATKNQKYEGYYTTDGKIQGHAKWTGGEGRDEGAWTVSDDGIYCDQFMGAWSKSGKRCYKVYPGQGENEYTLIKVSGSHSKQYPDGVIPLKITPGKNLTFN